MKILLSYSRRHFDPDLPPAEHRYWGSSASILARTLHALLSELGEVTYVDTSELTRVRGQSFDLFVGIINNFSAFLDACKIERAVCLVVNQHPSRSQKKKRNSSAKSTRRVEREGEKTAIKKMRAALQKTTLGNRDRVCAL